MNVVLYIIIIRMNAVDNLNSVQVINKPCVCSSTMRLSSVCGLLGDRAKQFQCSCSFPQSCSFSCLCSCYMQHVDAACACSMDLKFGHTTCKCSCWAGKKLPTLAHVDMKQWLVFSPELLFQGWLLMQLLGGDGPNRVKRLRALANSIDTVKFFSSIQQQRRFTNISTDVLFW